MPRRESGLTGKPDFSPTRSQSRLAQVGHAKPQHDEDEQQQIENLADEVESLEEEQMKRMTRATPCGQPYCHTKTWPLQSKSSATSIRQERVSEH